MSAPTEIKKELASVADPRKAEVLRRFFKTGKGEYGEGDRFLGVTVPKVRSVALKHWKAAGLRDIEALLRSGVHEHRFAALEMLVMKYESADEEKKGRIFRFYLKHADRINNWDLVDASVEYIIGDRLFERDRCTLCTLSRSRSVWKRRMSIVATFAFIKKGDLDDTFLLSERLMADKHDLIHKAVGWMLREAGKRDERRLRVFLDAHAKSMPRTMLRYAIERLPESTRRRYLKVRISRGSRGAIR